jgi:enamine deaminase RidA (YjgF/YER057c/UK114 family)
MDGPDRGGLQDPARRDRCRLVVREGYAMSAPREIIPSPGRATNARKSFDQMVSMALRGGDFLFVCGLTAVDLQSGEAMRGTTAGETRQILTNLKPLLEAAGSSLDKVVKVNVLLYSMLEAPNMNEVYTRF